MGAHIPTDDPPWVMFHSVTINPGVCHLPEGIGIVIDQANVGYSIPILVYDPTRLFFGFWPYFSIFEILFGQPFCPSVTSGFGKEESLFDINWVKVVNVEWGTSNDSQFL